LRTRVKICGITRPEDAIAAVKHGADAIGLVFYGPSPRNVSIEMAADIVSALPPFVSKVGLFVNASASEIETVLRRVSLDCLQFHGDESATDCAQINLPYYKAIRVKNDTNLLQYASYYAQAKALLLDTYSEASVGGTGQVFDWKLIPENIGKPLILAGGLTADNVAAAIRQVHPYAVDVSGGVEASKGIKDEIKIASFMREVDQLRS
jgi:phosphoribosylanthranilate isomerase